MSYPPKSLVRSDHWPLYREQRLFWLLLILIVTFRVLLYQPLDHPVGRLVGVTGRVSWLRTPRPEKTSFNLDEIKIFINSFSSVECGQLVRATGILEGELIGSPRAVFFLSDPKIEIIDSKATSSWLVRAGCGIGLVKRQILANSQKLVLGPVGEVINGLVWGSDAVNDRQLLQIFRQTGMIHLLAASGFNLLVVCGAVNAFLADFVSLKKRSWFLLVFVFSYAILVGGAAVWRAAIMAALVIVARLWGRSQSAWRGLFAAGFLMIIFDPALFWSTSFWLSFLATLGLLVGERLVPSYRFNWLIRGLLAGVWVQLAVWPVLANEFGVFSWLGLLLTPVTMLLVEVLTLFGLWFPLVGLVWPWLGRWLVLPVWGLGWVFYQLVTFFGRQGWGSWPVNHLPSWLLISYYVFWLLLIYLKRQDE